MCHICGQQAYLLRGDSGFAREELWLGAKPAECTSYSDLQQSSWLNAEIARAGASRSEDPPGRDCRRGLHVDDRPRELEPLATGGGQGRVHERGSQSPLRRHFTQAGEVQCQISLREAWPSLC